MTGAGESLARPRLLLTGDASARPTGLERALTRAGFHIAEAAEPAHEPPPDALLTTLPTADPERLRRLLADAAAEPPRVIVFAAEDRDAPAAALALGAADALAAPLHLPELCARIAARIRERQTPFRTPYEARVRDSLRDLIEEARSPLQPEEVALALVRRLGRALELSHCAFVVTRAGRDEGRVIAHPSGARAEHTHPELARHPEIAEAIRSRRALTMPDTRVGTEPGATMTILPVVVDDTVPGVLLLGRRPGDPALSAAQLRLAASLAEAAARALDAERGREGAHATPVAPPLDRRLQEELERARRYSLSFSLVLLGVDPAPENDPTDADERARRRQDVSGRIRRELRLPDFVSGYGEDAFAIVLPETGADGARRSVLRLRERLEGLSAGIVAYPHPAVTAPDDMFALVEAAHRRGRGRAGERIGVAE